MIKNHSMWFLNDLNTKQKGNGQRKSILANQIEISSFVVFTKKWVITFTLSVLLTLALNTLATKQHT